MKNIQKIILLSILFAFLSVLNAQSLFINEFMASNVTSTPEIVDYDDYSDWIEIYNDSSGAIDIGGYFLTDNLSNPTKWKFPLETIIDGKGYLILWADGYESSKSSYFRDLHLNFSLSKDGEEIGLFSPDGTLIDSISYNTQLSDVSFGRQPDGGRSWFYFGESTPRSSNITIGILNTEFAGSPEISLASGIYSGVQTFSITSHIGSVIRYTIDGSIPKSTSLCYTTPINITNNTILRARVFDDNKLPSKIITKSYFINQEQNLPILSLTVDPETFFSNEIGIYLRQIKSREVPVTAQLFEMNGDFAFEFDAGIRLTGEASIDYPQKPFTIETDDKYGFEFIDYKIFPERDFTNYTALYLRNSGAPDNGHTMFRDALEHNLVINDIDVDGQEYRPVATYINGEYWGIYNLREKINNNYFALNHGVDPNNIDIIEAKKVTEGIRIDYNKLNNFLENNDLSLSENYNYAKSRIDIDEFLNYTISQIFYANCDWLDNNTLWWRERKDGSKYRWVFQDLDNGFGMESWYCTSNYTDNFIEVATTDSNAVHHKAEDKTVVFRNLLDNSEFKNEFIQRFAIILNTLFKEERVLYFIDSLQNQISTEMVHHIERWNDNEPTFYVPILKDYDSWLSNVELMRDFARNRPSYQRQHILDYFNLSGTENLEFSVSDPNGGSISIAGINVEDGHTGKYFSDTPAKLKAIPTVGYRFVKWIGVPDSLSQTTYYSPTPSDASKQITVVFEEDNSNVLPSHISANTTLNISGSPYVAKGDIKISPNITLTIEHGVELLMPEYGSLIVNGTLEMNGTEELPIIIRPNEISGFNNWGVIYIENSTGESLISNVQLIGATNGSVLPNQVGAISSFKSDVTIENTTILDAPFPIFLQYGNVIVRNCNLHSDKTSDFINIKYAETALIENCEFRGNNSFDTDAIDLDEISNGIVRGNKIYNFYGYNSDGIDLGEGSKNILIENNLILNCNDKGISVGQASTTNIKNNIIVNCAQGIGIKDNSSFAFIDRNTFFGCEYGVASFEKNIGAGGGNAEIVNSVFSKSVLAPIFVDNLSTLTTNYSLSDTEILEGTENLNANPLLGNNFTPTSLSPTIDSGNPLTELDHDGSRADLGAKYFEDKYESLIINEIHYNPNNGDNYEFIELYNSGNEALDISGYKLSGEVDFTFPINSLIISKSFIVIANDKTLFENLEVQVFNWDGENLSNLFGNIILSNSLDEEIDFVSYSNKYDWPYLADGAGYSLELRNPADENLVTSHWKSSDFLGGSPGRANRIVLNDLLFINEFQADNKSTFKDEYDEYDDWIEIYNASDNSIDISGLYITDDFSNITKHQIPITNSGENIIAPKDHFILWADGNEEQGINHLDFKLKASGEKIALVSNFDNDTTIVDSISFGQQEVDFSYARINDGDDTWHIVHSPTPENRNSNNNLFQKGILLVNGFSFRNHDVIDSYENKAFWGNYIINFWDLLNEPTTGYLSILPDPIGHGPTHLDTLTNYSTVIWMGENSSIDRNYWNYSPVLEYAKKGGNLILLLKNGRDYFTEEMLVRLGITWVEPIDASLAECQSVYAGLDSIGLKSIQTRSSVFDTSLTNGKSTLLFTETKSYGETVGVGLWNKPEYGGMYNENGGQIIFLSGRAYRYDNVDLKNNIEYILKNILGETTVSVDGSENNLEITEYKLNQNFPNPFNPNTVIKYDLVKSSKVELKIFNILGQEVKTLVNSFEEKGRKTAIWNGEDNFNNKVSSGIYFYRISANDWNDIKKMILLK